MAINYDFSDRPDFDWQAPLKSEAVKQIEAEGHGWQGTRNDYLRVVAGMKEKLTQGQPLNHKERGFAIMLGVTPDRVVTITHHGDWPIRYYGLTTSEARANPTKHAQVYVDFHREFDIDLITPCAADCVVVEPTALGVPTLNPEDGTDQPKALLIKKEEDVWKLREYVESTDLRKKGQMPERLEMFKEMKRLSGDTIFLMAQSNAPLGLAWALCGHHNMMRWMKSKPQLMHLLLETCTIACFKFIDAWKEAGVHALLHVGGNTGMPYFREWQGQEFVTPYGARAAGYAWPLPVVQYNWGAPFAIGTDPQKYDPKKMGSEEAWLRWSMREFVSVGAVSFTNLASDADIPPGNNLPPYRNMGLYFKKAYQIGIHGEEMREGTPELITRKVVKWLLDMWPCEGGAWIRALFLDPITPKENVLALSRAVKEFGTFPIDKGKLEKYLKDNPGPLIWYEVKGLEGELLKKAAAESQAK
jgi:hypothetical protein